MMGLLFFSLATTLTWGCETRPLASSTSSIFFSTCDSVRPETCKRTGRRGSARLPAWVTRNSPDNSLTSKTSTTKRSAGPTVYSRWVFCTKLAKARMRSLVCCGVSRGEDCAQQAGSKAESVQTQGITKRYANLKERRIRSATAPSLAGCIRVDDPRRQYIAFQDGTVRMFRYGKWRVHDRYET